MAIPPRVRVRRPQESIAAAFFGLFPSHCFVGWSFPFVEDLVNVDTFCDYFDWTNGRGVSEQAAAACSSLQWEVSSQLHLQRAWQHGAFDSAYAPEPLLSEFASKQAHFEEALTLQHSSHPFESPPLVEWDTQFAVDWTLRHRDRLRLCR